MIEWMITAVAIGGNVLVIRRRREGFGCWILANSGWLAIACQNFRWAQATLWATYLGFAVWGFVAWKGQEK